MKIKSIVLSLILLIGFSTDILSVAQPNNGQSNLIKKAQTTFTEFKKTVKCTWRKKRCNSQERRRIIATGLAVVGSVLVIAGGGAWLLQQKRITTPQRKPLAAGPKAGLVSPGLAKPAVVAAPSVKISPQISAYAKNIEGLRTAYKRQMFAFKTGVNRGWYAGLTMGPILDPLEQKTSHLPEGDDRTEIEQSLNKARDLFKEGKLGLVGDARDKYNEFIQEANRGAKLLFDTIERLGKKE